MSYDLAACRAHFRFLIRDPNGDFLSDSELLSGYLNPAYLAWWRRNERRPGNLLGTISTTNMNGTDYIDTDMAAPGPDVVPLVESVVNRISNARWLGLRGPIEFERVYYLQTTEGLTGAPTDFAVRLAHLDSGGSLPSGISASPWLELWWYPVPDAVYTMDVYATVQPGLLVNDSDKMALDPVSARMVTRSAAYRAALDGDLEPERAQAIIAPVEAWAEQKRKFDAQFHGMPEMAA